MLRLVLVALALLFIGSIADVPAMFLAVRGSLPILFIFVVGFLADVGPDFFWYWLGGKIGLERIRRFRFFRRESKRLDKADSIFHRYGALMLFFSKFVYAFGIPTQIVAGAHHYNLKKMFIANALGSAGWLAVLYMLARTFTSEVVIEHNLHNAELNFTLFVVAGLIIYFLVSFIARRVLDLKR